MEDSPRGVMAKVLDYILEVSEFELQSCYYVHFRTNITGKKYKYLVNPATSLNNITAVFLQEWHWH